MVPPLCGLLGFAYRSASRRVVNRTVSHTAFLDTSQELFRKEPAVGSGQPRAKRRHGFAGRRRRPVPPKTRRNAERSHSFEQQKVYVRRMRNPPINTFGQ